MGEGFQILDHPVYPLPSRQQWKADPERVRAYLAQRNERIRSEREDPYYYGYRPLVWALVDGLLAEGKREVLILGGNRASKSEYCGRKVVEVLLSGEGKRVWCFQTTSPNSVEMQQPIVWRYIPQEYKGLKKNRVTNIAYSQKNGFSENKFIFPNGSECLFRNYAQDVDTVEGGEVDYCWCDELVPLHWLETIRYRLVTRAGILIVSFTPIQGYSPAVKEYLDGATNLLTDAAPLLGPKARVPRLQQPARKNAGVVYFHTSDNPFSNYQQLVRTLEGANRPEILCRAYGVPIRSMVARFPKFNEAVHVLAAGKVPRVGTRYCFCDPASARNWFLLWVLVDARGRHFVYREWPGGNVAEVGDPGPWAEADGRLADGRAGPAQTSFGWGLARYLQEIERVETDEQGVREELFGRWMDSRFGNTPNLKADAATTVLEECASLGLAFSPAPLDPVEEGISLINSMLDYDEARGLEPKLYVSDACPNLIFALRVWTGKDEGRGATKDPIDCLRYAALARLSDVESADLTLAGPQSY